MVKYATAIKNGTASTEAGLSRFTRAAPHPAYPAMLEVGKAQRTLFVARYLFDRDLQRQIEQGLNVVEAWNRANAIIRYGKSGEISTNQRGEVEMTARGRGWAGGWMTGSGDTPACPAATSCR